MGKFPRRTLIEKNTNNITVEGMIIPIIIAVMESLIGEHPTALVHRVVTNDSSIIWPFLTQLHNTGNSSYVTTREININGTKSSGILPPRKDTNRGYRTNDGEYY